MCFKNLARSFTMQVYVEVSKNHGYSLEEVIRGKFTPTIRLLITYYNNKFRKEQKEIEKMEKEIKKREEEVNN